ncbi:MAG: DUF2271 domain-containing protein [Candidatus Hydrogenedentes bacterium]|nr:DUF2271 domain-containing protein [Candidatus Hydrogenedentota bacterium]
MFHLGIARSALLALAIASHAAHAGVYTYHHENVLGTYLELSVKADSDAAAVEAEARVLAEIDRLAGILSRHDGESEFRRWQARGGFATAVSTDLLAVLRACDDWRARTGGAFDPAAGALTNLWDAAARVARTPSREEIADARDQMAAGRWRLDPVSGRAAPGLEGAATLDGLAKGYIIDRACEAALAGGAASGVLVNIGGDLRAAGTLQTEAAIANPFDTGEGAPPIGRAALLDGAMATSGGYHRFMEIAGRRYSHIVDPRTGMPAERVASATVIAPSAADADALATALNVLSPEEGTALVERVDGAASLVIGMDGSVTRSAGWRGPAPDRVRLAANGPAAAPAVDTWGARFSLNVDFELANPETDGRYRRPYVGIWVCDHEGFPVRTLLLWRQKGGLRWLSSLREWCRDDQIRAFVDETDLIETVSRSTRPPGKYNVSWDGLDDAGKPVPFGTYTLYIEASREHGTHQVMRAEIELGPEAFTKELDGNVEINGARIDYGPRGAGK